MNFALIIPLVRYSYKILEKDDVIMLFYQRIEGIISLYTLIRLKNEYLTLLTSRKARMTSRTSVKSGKETSSEEKRVDVEKELTKYQISIYYAKSAGTLNLEDEYDDPQIGIGKIETTASCDNGNVVINDTPTEEDAENKIITKFKSVISPDHFDNEKNQGFPRGNGAAFFNHHPPNDYFACTFNENGDVICDAFPDWTFTPENNKPYCEAVNDEGKMIFDLANMRLLDMGDLTLTDVEGFYHYGSCRAGEDPDIFDDGSFFFTIKKI